MIQKNNFFIIIDENPIIIKSGDQKEIELLVSISQPDFGYITNFGKAHLEGFGGIEGVIKGKSELYDYLRTNHRTAFVNFNDCDFKFNAS